MLYRGALIVILVLVLILAHWQYEHIGKLCTYGLSGIGIDIGYICILAKRFVVQPNSSELKYKVLKYQLGTILNSIYLIIMY